MRALVRFFRTPPLALRIVVGVALGLELFALVGGLVSVAPAVRDAVGTPAARAVAGTLLFAAAACAAHGALAAFVVGAALLARRAPWLSAALAIVPVALAALGARASVGFSFALADVRLEQDTLWALAAGASGHIVLAALASVIALLALPFGLIRRRGGEGGRPAPNSGAS
jgi:hypothetical protein